MIEIVSIVIILGVCGYVVMPLLQKREQVEFRESTTDSRVSELLHQHVMADAIIEDLEFDLQTGKLSQEDYESLVADQRKIQKEADARLKDIGGMSSTELTEKLEREIAAEKQKLAPDSSPTCPGCKKQITPGDKFCSECGTKLA